MEQDQIKNRDLFKQNEENNKNLFNYNDSQNQIQFNDENQDPNCNNQKKLYQDQYNNDKQLAQIMDFKKDKQRIEIRKKKVQQQLQEQRSKIKRFAAKSFDVKAFEDILGHFKSISTMQIDEIIARFDQLGSFDYDENQEFEDYYAKTLIPNKKYNSPLILDVIFQVLQTYKQYNRIMFASYNLLEDLTCSSQICSDIITKKFQNQVLHQLNNCKDDEIVLKSYAILSNLAADQFKFTKKELSKLYIYNHLQKYQLIDREFMEQQIQLVSNYSFNEFLSVKEIQEGFKIIAKFLDMISNENFDFMPSDTEEERQKKMGIQKFHDLLVITLESFARLLEHLVAYKGLETYQFDEPNHIIDLIFTVFVKKVCLDDVRPVIKEVFQYMSLYEEIGASFFQEYKSYFVQLFEIDFTFISVFTEALLQNDIHNRYLIREFLSLKPNIFDDLIQKIAKQNNTTNQERMKALKFLEAFLDHQTYNIIDQYLNSVHIMDAIALNLDQQSDPSLNNDIIETALEVLSGILDHGQQLALLQQQDEEQTNQNKEQQQNTTDLNKYRNRGQEVGIPQLLTYLCEGVQHEDIAQRASTIYDQFYSDLYN